MTPQPTRHLDIGCGALPRNPYNRAELHGVDIAPVNQVTQATIRQANLALQPIPYPDHYFNSISAFDFLEHIPRILPTADGSTTRFPFIELINEVHRTLYPGGVFTHLHLVIQHRPSSKILLT
jgi:SAM-dependent methyltransferase